MTHVAPTEELPESAAPWTRGRRRNLTVMFSDIQGSTKLQRTMEHEDYSELVRGLQAIFAEVIERHGGELVRIMGDGVLAVFGYPEAHEDDGRRATETALDLHEETRRFCDAAPGLSVAIRLHTGIHSGLVLFEEGDQVRGRFEPFGDATNVAAHLSDAASEDEIIVSVATLGSERHFFRTSAPRLTSVAGDDSAPIETLSVLGRDTTENRFAARVRRGLAPFVGRHEELEQLRACLRESRHGANRMAAIVGSPGLGKTRLANEFLAEAAVQDFQVYRGYCEFYLGARPLQPFLQMLHSIFETQGGMAVGQAGELVAEGLARLGPDLIGQVDTLRRLLSLQVAGSDVTARAAPAAAECVALLREIFERLAQRGPIIVFIDDWQWADDISRQVLDAVRAIERLPIFVLLGTREYRGVEAQMSGATVIELSPLDAAAAAQVIGGLLKAPAPFVVERVADYAGGNPLFIEELCQSQTQGGDGQGAESRSAWLDALIASRFSRLLEDQARVVRAASVVGHTIPAWLFEEITGYGLDQATVVELAHQDFIYPGEVPGTLRFKHGITRDAIYHTVGLRERRALHMRVAGALKQRATSAGENENCEGLAYHLAAGGDRAQAAHYAERAGDQAMAVSSLDRAQDQYRAALTALEGLEQTEPVIERWNAIVRKLGMACVVDPSRDPIPIFERAIVAARAREDVGALAWSEYWLGYIYYGLGDARRSLVHCKRALTAAETHGDDRLTVQVRATLGQVYGIACQYEPALALLDEAIEVKRRHRSGIRQSVGLAYSEACKAFVLADQGKFDESYALYADALGIVGDELHQIMGSLLTQMSAACLWQGRMDEALNHAKEAERVAGKVKARYLFSMARALAAYAQWVVDGSPAALEVLVEATASMEASESRQFLSLSYGWLTEAMVSAGRIPEARRYAARALHRARQGDRQGEAMAYRALARAAARGAWGRSAGHYIARATAAGEARGAAHELPKTLICAAEIAFAVGDRETATSLLAQARPDLSAMGMDWFQAVARAVALA